METFKKTHHLKANNQKLKSVILDLNRSLDKIITVIVNEYKREVKTVINSSEKEKIRRKIYYEFIHDKYEESDLALYNTYAKHIDNIHIEELLNEAIHYLSERFAMSEKEKENILGTIHTRIHYDGNEEINKKYKEYIHKEEKQNFQLIILKVDKTMSVEIMMNQIRNAYDKLSNYHYLAIVFDSNIQNSWEYIAKAAIYAENFYQENHFKPFKKEKQIQSLKRFLMNNTHYQMTEQQASELGERFYSSMSAGYHFTDLFISDDAKEQVLMLQKVKLDMQQVPCPDCFDFNARSNSYTKTLMRSFECNNPNCISRSKSGRGKRFNYLSAKLNYKKETLTKLDYVPNEIYKSFRRDIYSNKLNIQNTILRLYTFEGENILTINNPHEIKNQGRKLTNVTTLENEKKKINYIDTYEELPIVEFVQELKTVLKQTEKHDYNSDKEIQLIHDNSTSFLSKVKENTFHHAVTSPPYYNVREYSQWENMICYFVDMFANAYHVYHSLDKEAVYLYNIGDVVDQDNIYVPTTMSKRRQLLGLYSVLIMESIGFYLKGNIVWDKGEVQSKRNSTSDLLPHYVKTINSYEHIFVFSKNQNQKYISKIAKFTPVIKINSKKENTIKHTAPYPKELVNQLKTATQLKPNDIILDPFLGSGTTALWCLENNLQCLGIELSKEYHQVALERLKVNT